MSEDEFELAADALEKGQYYKISGDRRFKENAKVKFCGIVWFNGSPRCEVWSDDSRLLHWVNPADLKPAK